MKKVVLVLSLIVLSAACSREPSAGGADFSSLDGDTSYHSYEALQDGAVNEKAFTYTTIDIQQNQSFLQKQYISLDGVSGTACEIGGTWEYPVPADDSPLGNVLRVNVTSVNGVATSAVKDYELQTVNYDTLKLRFKPEEQAKDLTNIVLVPAYNELDAVNLNGFSANSFCN